jgi:hypothetical protein
MLSDFGVLDLHVPQSLLPHVRHLHQLLDPDVEGLRFTHIDAEHNDSINVVLHVMRCQILAMWWLWLVITKVLRGWEHLSHLERLLLAVSVANVIEPAHTGIACCIQLLSL